jgi:hypothetical protein
MTTSQRIKIAVIAALNTYRPSDQIAVVDAKQRAEIDIPVLAVDITSAEAHSEALQHVERLGVQVILRCHAGDDDDIDGWIDQIETLLTDVSLMKALATDTVKVYSWVYGGSTQDWDESMLEVTFSAECLVARFLPQPQSEPEI